MSHDNDIRFLNHFTIDIAHIVIRIPIDRSPDTDHRNSYETACFFEPLQFVN